MEHFGKVREKVSRDLMSFWDLEDLVGVSPTKPNFRGDLGLALYMPQGARASCAKIKVLSGLTISLFQYIPYASNNNKTSKVHEE